MEDSSAARSVYRLAAGASTEINPKDDVVSSGQAQDKTLRLFFCFQ
jgi:hypothetical protein